MPARRLCSAPSTLSSCLNEGCEFSSGSTCAAKMPRRARLFGIGCVIAKRPMVVAPRSRNQREADFPNRRCYPPCRSASEFTPSGPEEGRTGKGSKGKQRRATSRQTRTIVYVEYENALTPRATNEFGPMALAHLQHVARIGRVFIWWDECPAKQQPRNVNTGAGLQYGTDRFRRRSPASVVPRMPQVGHCGRT